MDYSQYSYYKLNEKLLSTIGQWPYETGKSSLIRKIVVNLVFFTCTVVQVIKLIEENFDIDLLLQMIPMLAMSVSASIVTLVCYSKSHVLRDLCEQMAEDWTSELLEPEEKIKTEYAKIGHFLIKFFSRTLGIMFVIVSTFVPVITDIMDPSNGSHTHQIIFEAEIFFDKQKHFFYAMLYIDVTACIVVLSGIAMESMFIVHLAHIFGMFAVLGYRLENAIPNDLLRSTEKIESINEIYQYSILLCIKRHQKAIQLLFATTLEDYYSFNFAITSIMSLLMITPALVQVSDMQSLKQRDIFEVIFVICFWFEHNYLGQKLIDLSTEVATKVYFSKWYLVSVRIQKYLPLIIRRCDKPCTINVYDIFISSLNCFRQVIQAGLSYCMFIKQVR